MILFIQTAFLGDLLLSIPALRRLRTLYPNTKIHLVCRKGLGSVVQQYGLVDEIHDNFKKTKPSLREWRQRFGSTQFDLVICPHESVRSKILCLFTKAKYKIGYKSVILSRVFDETYERPKTLPEVLRQMVLLQGIDPEVKMHLEQISSQPFMVYKKIPQWSSMVLVDQKFKQSSRAEFAKLHSLDTTKKWVAIAPGSVWPTKRWPLESFTALSQQLVLEDKIVILVGSPDEKKFGDQIEKQVPQVVNLCGKTKLPELSRLLASCDLLVGNDSGSMHMASVVDTPMVSIFGPTVLEFGYQPWSNHFKIVEQKGLKCRPCSSHGGARCPLGTHDCMKMIHSTQVLEASATLLEPRV